MNDIKSDTLQAELLSAQGDLKFYGGDIKAARPLYEQALRAATKGNEKDKILGSKLNLAQLAIAEGRPQSAVADLQNIVKQADTLNLKYLSLSSAIEIGRATINSKDYARARQDLERDLGRSEKLGSRLQSARIHYLLGETIRLAGNSRDAVAQYAQALRLFDELKKDPGAEHLLQRPDLKQMYDTSNQYFSSPNS